MLIKIVYNNNFFLSYQLLLIEEIKGEYNNVRDSHAAMKLADAV